MFFCQAGPACIAATKTADGVTKPAVVGTSKTLCAACRRRTVPSAAVPNPAGNTSPAAHANANATATATVTVRDGRAVRIDEDGLPVDVLDGSPFALLPVVDVQPAGTRHNPKDRPPRGPAS